MEAISRSENHVFMNSSAVLENADFEQTSNEHLELIGGY